jgi:hypothetical protein
MMGFLGWRHTRAAVLVHAGLNREAEIKKSRIILYDPGYPVLTAGACPVPVPADAGSIIQAGLLTSGSTSSRVFPFLTEQ